MGELIVTVKLNTIEEWDLVLRYSWLPSQHGGLALAEFVIFHDVFHEFSMYFCTTSYIAFKVFWT